MDNPNDIFDELMIPSSENSPMKPNLSTEDSFNPHGLKVLVVDNDPDSLLHLTEMLTSCQYQATTCSLPTEALALIRDENNKFDIVVTEVHFSPGIDGVEFLDFSPGTNGVEFLEIIVRETELPVVIVSADDSIDTITECIMKGACTCIPKPVKKEVIQFLWQHVARKVLRHKLMKPTDKLEVSEPSSSTSVEDKDLCGSSSSEDVAMDGDQPKDQAKRTRMVWTAMDGDQITDQAKKARMVWTADLDCQFVDAVKHLGIKNAVPKKLLELMNVPGLKREHVASHLQKYRKKLKMLSTNMEQRVIEQSSLSSDAYIPVLKNNESYISSQPITEVQQEQDFSTQIPSGANSHVMGNNGLLIRSSPITQLQQRFIAQDSSTQLAPNGAYSPVIQNNWFAGRPSITNDEFQHHFTVQDSSTQLVPNGAYHPVIENDWIVGFPPMTHDELQTLQQLELDNPLSPLRDLVADCNLPGHI